MARILCLVFGVAAYLLFFATFLYLTALFGLAQVWNHARGRGEGAPPAFRTPFFYRWRLLPRLRATR